LAVWCSYEAGHPGHGFFQNGSIEGVADEMPLFFRNNQVGLAEQVEMIGDARQTDGKMAADFAYGEIAFSEQFQDATAGRIIEGAKKLLHRYLNNYLNIEIGKKLFRLRLDSREPQKCGLLG